MPYLTVAKAHARKEVVKGSSFVAFVTPVQSVDEARLRLDNVRTEHAEATHNCYAYRVGPDMKFSDDGEPGGTAGRPMLEVLQKRELDFVLAAVTRYYGGTKLGAGGLVRAYSGSLAKALDEAGVVTVRETVTRTVSLDGWAGLHKGEAAYSAAGLELSVTLYADDETPLADALTEATRGEAVMRTPLRTI